MRSSEVKNCFANVRQDCAKYVLEKRTMSSIASNVSAFLIVIFNDVIKEVIQWMQSFKNFFNLKYCVNSSLMESNCSVG
jgi:hypothetical protein